MFRVGGKLVAPSGANSVNFSYTKIQIISSIQCLPLVKQESFLRAKYEAEGLSVNEITVIGQGDTVIFKSITPPSMDKFEGILAEARDSAKRAGLKKSDVKAAIKKVRRQR